MRWTLSSCCVMLLLAALACFPPTTDASGGNSDPDPEGTKYFELFPNFVTNYQKDNGKVGYLSIGIQLKIKGAAGVELIKQHLPLLQDAVVWLMRGQTDASVRDLAQRENLRQQTLTELQTRLETETKQKAIIEDVLFTRYVWQ